MEFSDFLQRIRRLNLAHHGRTPFKYPYKLLLLASVVDLIGAGELPTPELVLDDVLEGVFRDHLQAVFPDWPYRAPAGQPFWHLASDTGVFEPVTDPAYTAVARQTLGADWRRGLGLVRAMRLPEDVHRRLCADHLARMQLLELLDEQLRVRCGATRSLLAVPRREEDFEPASSVTEKVLEDTLVRYWQQSAFGQLNVNLSRPELGLRAGRQVATPAGRIDILGWQPLDCTWWVVELKKGRSDDRVVGQAQRYMGFVRASTGEPVRGAVVVQEISPRLRLATQEAGLSLWRFELDHEHLVRRDVGTKAAA